MNDNDKSKDNNKNNDDSDKSDDDDNSNVMQRHAINMKNDFKNISYRDRNNFFKLRQQ